MSDILQTLPKGLKEKEAGRIEVLWYVNSAETWMYDFLVALAKMPFQYKSYYWRFHTLENGFPNPLPDSLYKH